MVHSRGNGETSGKQTADHDRLYSKPPNALLLSEKKNAVSASGVQQRYTL